MVESALALLFLVVAVVITHTKAHKQGYDKGHRAGYETGFMTGGNTVVNHVIKAFDDDGRLTQDEVIEIVRTIRIKW